EVPVRIAERGGAAVRGAPRDLVRAAQGNRRRPILHYPDLRMICRRTVIRVPDGDADGVHTRGVKRVRSRPAVPALEYRIAFGILSPRLAVEGSIGVDRVWTVESHLGREVYNLHIGNCHRGQPTQVENRN